MAALAAVGLVTAGCGARWSDEQRASVEARAGSAAVEAGPLAAQGAGPVAGAGGGASTGGSAAASGAAGGSDGAGAGTAGTGADATGAGAAEAAGALPCSAPSDAPGVTDSTISIGSISTISGFAPGLGESAAAAVRAYVAHRNATGGVCGRQLVLQEADDGGDSARYRSVIQEVEPRVIGFAGGLSIGDEGAADIISGRAIPMIASRSAEGVQGQPTIFDLNPPFPDPPSPIGKYDFIVSQGVTDVAMVYLAVDASRAEARTQRRLMEASGMRIVEVIELPVTTLSFDSAARSVANSGADYLFFLGAVTSNASMARAMADTGYDLAFLEVLEFGYGTDFAELAGPAGEGVITWIRSLPTEEASSNASVAAFAEWMATTAPGTDTDPLAADSWVAAKLLVDSLEALPGPITRQALVDHLRSTDTYDADGMLGPIRLGPQRNLGCSIGMQLRGGTWQRLTPASGFLCSSG